MILFQCTCTYDEWRVSPDTVLKEKMKYRGLCIISSTNGGIMLIYARVCVEFPSGSAGKESACSVEDLGSIPELGRPPGEGKGYPLQYSGLENSPWGHKESDTTERLSLSLPSHARVCLVAQSCPALCDPMNGRSARLLCPWGFSRGSSQPRDRTQVSRIAGRFFTS